MYGLLNTEQTLHAVHQVRFTSHKSEAGLWEDAMSNSLIISGILLFMSGRSTFLPPRSSDRLNDSGRLTDSTRADKERPCIYEIHSDYGDSTDYVAEFIATFSFSYTSFFFIICLMISDSDIRYPISNIRSVYLDNI